MSAVRDMAVTPTLRGQFPTRPAEVVPPSRREKVVLALICTTTVLSVWMFGSWQNWSQEIILILAGLTFAALFVPMSDYRRWPPSPSAKMIWGRLKQFPIFWMGLAILLYGVAAALNPSRILITSNGRSWFENVPHLSFLPHGVITTFSEMNAWHALMIIVPAWLVLCAAWTGLDTEQSWHRLLAVLATNGAVLALVGIIQAFSNTRYMLWFYDAQPNNPEPAFFGSFVWAGHAAAWMTLALGAVAGITDHHLRRRDPQEASRRWGWPAFRAWIWLGAFIVIFAALEIFVKPDFWWLAGGGVILISVGLWLTRMWWEGHKRRAALYALPALAFMGVMLLTTGGAVWMWRQGLPANHFEVNPHDPDLPARFAFAKTSAVMIKDEPVFGWGPGSFRYISPYYLALNPAFRDPAHPGDALYGLQYTLNDWVQYTAEWGLVGLGLFLATASWWVWKAWQLRRVLPGESWIALGAVAIVFAEAAVDCPFYNPAVLIALALLPGIAIKLGEISARPRPALSKVVVACP